MNHRLDKKNKNKSFLQITVLGILLLLVIVFYNPMFRGLSYIFHIISRPVLILTNTIGGKIYNMQSFLESKNILLKENETLRNKLNENEANMANYNSILAENTKLKEDWGRKKENTNMIVATILSKPNISLYDTLIIDIGENNNIKIGNNVFAFGSVPIGRVREVYKNSSKVVLFSTGGEKTQVVLSGQDIFLELVGRGGGNFEMIIPRDLEIPEYTE
ncbi:MAG: hypothetical protein M3P22_01805, partial [bacterium]|nr:hypothetical protein [bacterium]